MTAVPALGGDTAAKFTVTRSGDRVLIEADGASGPWSARGVGPGASNIARRARRRAPDHALSPSTRPTRLTAKEYALMSTARTFPSDFLWGSATAAYQIEGGVTAGGSPSNEDEDHETAKAPSA